MSEYKRMRDKNGGCTLKSVNSMGYLIELLNEYSEIIEDRITGEEGQPIHKWKEEELGYNVLIRRIISKTFGFIRWLCDNNKINIDIVYQKGFLAKTYDKDEAGECFEPYEEILMLLSISDEPIDFLCSILKEGEKKESEGKLVKGGYASFNEYGELMEADTLQELKDLGKI